MKKILFLLLVVFATLTLTSCDTVHNKTYYLNKMEVSGVQYNVGDMLGTTKITKEMLTITFKQTGDSAGTGTLTVKTVKEEAKTFEWSKEGDNYYITIKGEKYVARFDGELLKMDMEGIIYYFKCN